ncbi:H/ACA ribonucleoprotein complex subunit 1 [Fonticula alba]|uniref:H/ACA ribonucleoprotein complex subunit n=1 Tax=Fonticula alba TaxID=691883 RepID=A0A058ZA55_FONAL|nr:H/ACA ribonucleoprotein complex subunit 1 [Fonticula alba]KCV71130.1 H/ACA ribonucleoprotein complex subunit 1 [Fonticula alba]|eukprot:XP_009494253.1 H/ACA ribonucleoprotein complex subunit 1 [Fonticula alba]
MVPPPGLGSGVFRHQCEGELVLKLTNEKIPYFNAPIFLNKDTQVGKVEEIFGPINDVFFTVKLQPGFVASSFKVDDKLFIGSDKLLPLARFLPQPKPAGKVARPAGGARGGGRGGARGGFGGGRGGGFGGGRGGGFGGGRGGGFGGGRGGGRGGGFGGGRGGGFGARGGGSFRGRS